MLPIPTLDCGLVRLQFADEELMESLCENEKDVPHLVGR
jgi:hypothetical protein